MLWNPSALQKWGPACYATAARLHQTKADPSTDAGGLPLPSLEGDSVDLNVQMCRFPQPRQVVSLAQILGGND